VAIEVVFLSTRIVVAEVMLKHDPICHAVLILIRTEEGVVEVDAVIDHHHGVAAAVEAGKPRIGAQQIQADQSVGSHCSAIFKAFDSQPAA
jgi:hypothetical protein